MRTRVAYKYLYPYFPKGRFKQFALELAQFINISPSDVSIMLDRKEDGFEVRTEATLDDLENICDIGTTSNELSFIYDSNHMYFSLDTSSKTLSVSYLIYNDLEATQKFISFVEDTLELSRLSEQEIRELTDGYHQNILNNLSTNESEVPLETTATGIETNEFQKSVLDSLKEIKEILVEHDKLFKAIEEHFQEIKSLQINDKNQKYFWSEQWQKQMKQSQQDLDNGNYKSFENMEDCIKDLEEHALLAEKLNQPKT